MNLRHQLLRTTTAITAVCALLAIGLTGATSAAAVPVSVLVPTPTELVTQVLLSNGDLATGYRTKPVPGGKKLRGHPTLENCGYHFTTEKNRAVRRQVVIMKGAGMVNLSHEVVAYDTAAHAALALTQLRQSVRRCPLGMYVTSTVKGEPDIRYDVSNVHSLPTLPVADNAGISIKQQVRGQKYVYLIIIAQRARRVLSLFYTYSAKPPINADIDAMVGFAIITGKRLSTE